MDPSDNRPDISRVIGMFELSLLQELLSPMDVEESTSSQETKTAPRKLHVSKGKYLENRFWAKSVDQDQTLPGFLFCLLHMDPLISVW